MSASSRFGYSMFGGAVLSGLVVYYEATKRPAALTAYSAAHHMDEGGFRLYGFALLAVAIGLILFVLASLVLLKASNKRGSSSRQPAQGRQRSYGGSR
jgi:hypothetical protein